MCAWCSVRWGEVLIPTYLKAPPEEFTPYVASALRPALPIVMPGVTANTWEGEWKQPEVAVMQWWKVSWCQGV